MLDDEEVITKTQRDSDSASVIEERLEQMNAAICEMDEALRLIEEAKLNDKDVVSEEIEEEFNSAVSRLEQLM